MRNGERNYYFFSILRFFRFFFNFSIFRFLWSFSDFSIFPIFYLFLDFLWIFILDFRFFFDFLIFRVFPIFHNHAYEIFRVNYHSYKIAWEGVNYAFLSFSQREELEIDVTFFSMLIKFSFGTYVRKKKHWKKVIHMPPKSLINYWRYLITWN